MALKVGARIIAALERAGSSVLRNWLRIAIGGGLAIGLMLFGYIGGTYATATIDPAGRIGSRVQAVLSRATAWVDHKFRGEAALSERAHSWTRRSTALQELEVSLLPLLPLPTRAGGMAQLGGDTLLASTAYGQFVIVDPNTSQRGEAAISSPINLEEFRKHPLWNTPRLNRQWFRVNDILAVARGNGAFTLFATHYRFTERCIEFHLSRTTIEASGLDVRQTDSWRSIFTATPCFQVLASATIPWGGHLSGGRMLDYDADKLLVTVGDQMMFETRGANVAQDPDATMGKILLIDKETGAFETFASGQRNALGLFRDSSGRIWETENGPQGGDELNLIRQGDNLGWPHVTYGVNYDQRPWPGASVEGRHENYVRPVFAWAPSVGISNLLEASGDMFPNWRGDLLVGSLGGNTLFRIRLEGDDAIYAEPIRFSGHGLRDMVTLADGRIAILDNDMSLLQIRNGAGRGGGLIYNGGDVAPQVAAHLPNERAAAVAHGAALYAQRCVDCHSIGAAAIRSGPPLRDVVGRRIGGVSEFTYSTALSSARGTWTEAALAHFLHSPDSLGGDVAMPDPGLTRTEAEKLAAYLAEVGRQDVRARQ